MRHIIFGESHGPAIGVVLEGVPAGLELDLKAVQAELDRRAPGKDPTATARKEADKVDIISGFFEGRTTGAPLCMVIRNSDQHSADYEAIRWTPRPSHGDYAGFIASKGALDYRGGGHFSGRLTAPLVAAGAVVIADVPPETVVAGVPARVIKAKDEKAAGKTALVEALREL